MVSPTTLEVAGDRRCCPRTSTVSRAAAAVILIRSLTTHLGEVRLLRASSLTTRVAATWLIPVSEAISATSTMVASMSMSMPRAAAAAKNAEVVTTEASTTGKEEEEEEEERTCSMAAARPEEAGTPSATSAAESLVSSTKVPEEAGTASTVAAAASAVAATVSAAGETTRKPSAGVPVPSALAALPRGTWPDARLTLP
jgi:hypothetical protein